MIQRKRLLKTFLDIVSIDSESWHEEDTQAYIKDTLGHLGMTCFVDETGNLYGSMPANRSEAEPVLLSAHMDTVSPGIGKKAILHEDGLITSDGTTVLGADDVSGIAEILEVLTVLHEKDLPHGEIEVLFPVAEELFSLGSKSFDFSRIKSKKAYTLDMSGPIGTAALAAPSIHSITVTIHGKSSHAGFAPEKGIHSIAIAADALSRLENGFVEEDTCVNFGTIQGGSGRNIVPASTVITGEVRSMDDKKADARIREIRDTFESSASRFGGRIEFSDQWLIHSYRIREDEEVARAYAKACEKTGLPAVFMDTFGGSDNNRFTEYGIRGIVLSSGMNKVHTVEEYTHVDDLVLAAQILLNLVTL